MIIVSQERNGVYNFDNVKSIDVVDNGIYITDDILADRGTLIAIYEKEERAKEVLQEIINKYKEVKMICDINNKKYEVVDRPKIYEMPKE